MARLLLTNVAIAGILWIGVILSVNCIELEYTDITVIGKNNSYQTLNPQATFDLFDKIRHVKGNIIFSKGKRITGDQLILNHLDSEQFSKPEDIEVFLRYPSGSDGKIITLVEVLADPDTTSKDANTGFIKGTGGINNKTFELLVQCKYTANFAYEIFIYGY
ncbi:uncharacterized protein LOC129912026 [Episyrphus balteatus]|uniref:uncharacterized protein LOC129912026 n=1 Tax=Episyrphus balteatus TaxID=286459 RepID=UPI0024865EA5|nr:uncharacterized protein LOC129912026 [Episyrphus balteatus]